MKTYIAQRLGIAVLTLFGMSIVIFVLLRLAPGNIVDILFSTGRLREPVGARRPSRASSGSTSRSGCSTSSGCGQLLVGDLGKSYRYDLPAWEIIRPLIPVTLELAVLVAHHLGGARRARSG